MSKEEKRGANQRTLADTVASGRGSAPDADLVGMSPVALGDGTVEVAAARRNGGYVVLVRKRVDGKVQESIVKDTDSRLIAADRLAQALLESGL